MRCDINVSRIGFAFAVCALGCHEAKPERAAAAPVQAAPVVVASTVYELPESEVRALVETWLAAQNGGRFDQYEKLYAQRFTGIKRVGERSRTFNRAGWLEDRARMFAKPMKVTAENVQVRLRGQTALVSLKQTFAQGAFTDVGPKELVVVRTPDGAKIAREEMLRSSVGPGHASGMVLLEIRQETYVVLATQALPVADGQFEALAAGRGFTRSGRRALSADAAGPVLASWRGKTLQVYPGDRECAIGQLYVLGVGTPHFGVEQSGNGDRDLDGVVEATPLPEAQRHERGIGAEMVVGLLPDCHGSIAFTHKANDWAAIVDNSIAERAAAAFLKNSGAKKLQQEFEAYQGNHGPWFKFNKSQGVQSRIFQASDGRRLVVVGAEAHAGCADFGGSLFLAFSVVDGALVPLGDVPGLPEHAVAPDNRSLPILVGWPWTSSASGVKAYQQSKALDLGYRDCPC